MIEAKRFRRALIPLDGSVTAEAVIPAVLELALALDLELILLQVLAPVVPQVSEGAHRVPVNPMERLEEEAGAFEILDVFGIDLYRRGDVLPASFLPQVFSFQFFDHG